MRKWVCRGCRMPVVLHFNHVAEVKCEEDSTSDDCSGTFEHRDWGTCALPRELSHDDVYLMPLGVM